MLFDFIGDSVPAFYRNSQINHSFKKNFWGGKDRYSFRKGKRRNKKSCSAGESPCGTAFSVLAAG